MLAASTVDFENDKKQQVTGVQVHYVMLDADAPRGTVGMVPMKQFMTGTATANITKAPAIYEAAFAVKVKEGKPTMVLASLSFKHEVDLASAV